MNNTMIENLKSRYVIRKNKTAASGAAVNSAAKQKNADEGKASAHYRRMHPLQIWTSPSFFFHVTNPEGEKH